MAEATSATTYMVLPALPWSEKAPPIMVNGEFERAALFQSGIRKECLVQSISAMGATLQGPVALAGDAVTIELATGQRPSGRVAWASGSWVGVGFDDPIDILAQINRNLVSQPVERRKMPRVELRCAGWLKDGDQFSMATVRNISAGGLQLESEALPETGAEVILFLEGLNIPPGELIWRREKLAGVQFRHELSWAMIMPWLREMLQNSAT